MVRDTILISYANNEEGKRQLEAQSKMLVQRVYQTIRTHRMFEPGDRVLVGVSGGPDSVALLYVLNAISSKLNITLAIGHFNHDLRGKASDRDAGFVANLAAKLQTVFYSDKKDVRAYRHHHRLSLETAARQLRYAFFFNIIKTHAFSKIALGHHMDDNAEQILMNLLRGSGPAGLSGIPPVRDQCIVRPMIDVTRKQIMDYLGREKCDYVIDASNTDLKHLRNRIRLKLMPHLVKQYNPRLVQRLNQMAEVFRGENHWMAQAVEPIFKAIAAKKGPRSIAFLIPKLAQLDPAIQRRLFRRAIKQITGDLKKISFDHIEAIRELLNDGRETKSIDLPHRIRVRRMDQSLVLSRETEPLRSVSTKRVEDMPPSFAYPLQPPGELILEEVGLKLVFRFEAIEKSFKLPDAEDETAYLDAERLSYPLIVRNQKVTDRFSPLGLGGTQTVRKYLSTREKNLYSRFNCPVMICDNRIVWVVGYGIADEVKIGRSTRRALMVQVSLA